MAINDMVVIYASDGQVKFHIDGIGQLQMTSDSAVALARQLLDAANEIEPGSGGYLYPPKIDLT